MTMQRSSSIDLRMFSLRGLDLAVNIRLKVMLSTRSNSKFAVNIRLKVMLNTRSNSKFALQLHLLIIV